MTEEQLQRKIFGMEYKGVEKKTGFQIYDDNDCRHWYEINGKQFRLRKMSLIRNALLEEEEDFFDFREQRE